MNASAAEIRFWSQVNKDGPEHPELGKCWIWRRSIGLWQYGRLVVDTRLRYAHAYSYELHCAPVPVGICVLHKCDTPACVNPEHLFLGTRADNNLDRDRKGRGGRHDGTLNGRAILTPELVAEIREKHIRGHRELGTRGLAKVYGVSPSAISAIVLRNNWR